MRYAPFFDFKKQCWLLRIQVRDTGVGMTESEKGKLFRLFGVLSSTKKQNSRGIGLGLVICKMIVEQFGGTIRVESRKGKGSLFSFTMKILDRIDPSPQDRVQNKDDLDLEDLELVEDIEDQEEADLSERDPIEQINEARLQIYQLERMEQAMPRILIVDDF